MSEKAVKGTKRKQEEKEDKQPAEAANAAKRTKVEAAAAAAPAAPAAPVETGKRKADGQEAGAAKRQKPAESKSFDAADLLKQFEFYFSIRCVAVCCRGADRVLDASCGTISLLAIIVQVGNRCVCAVVYYLQLWLPSFSSFSRDCLDAAMLTLGV